MNGEADQVPATTAQDAHPVVAIDGPAASGKSSVAQRISEMLEMPHVNTGDSYRAAAWLAIREGIPPGKPKRLINAMKSHGFILKLENGGSVVEVDGTPLDRELRESAVNENVSEFASLPDVRAFLVAMQRSLAYDSPLVMEGRDIGTVVFPASPYKFYIDASPEIRQSRRAAQGEADEVATRDRRDLERAASPLTLTDDAVYIDSSELSLDQVVNRVVQELERLRHPLLP